MAQYRVNSLCPTCGGVMTITTTICHRCHTEVRGDFGVSRFDLLSDDQLVFLERFLRARGNIRDVERETGLSYPTVRSRLDSVLQALGLGDNAKSSALPQAAKLAVLDGLADGSVDVETAVRYFKHELPENEQSNGSDRER